MKLFGRVMRILPTVAMIVTIILASTTPVAAAPGNMSWTGQPLPSATSNVIVSGSDITDIAVANDGSTVYMANSTNQTVYRSGDAGQSFTRLTAYEAIGGVAAPTAIGVAYDNASAIAVTDGAMVYYSNNGGTTWATLPALAGASANATITDVAVGPARAGTILGREYAIAVADPNDSATDTANQQGDVLIIGKIATWASAGATDNITGDMDYMAVAFTPNFVTYRCLVAVGASVGSGSYSAGVYFHLINTSTGLHVISPTQLHSVATDYETTPANASDIVAADIALPSNYDPTTGSGRRAYVGIGTAATYTNDDVYRIDNTTSTKLGAVSAQPIKSVAYSGNITDGTLFIGQNNYNGITWRSNWQVSLPPIVWTTSQQNPSGTNSTIVRVPSDFATSNRVFVGTSGADSAFSMSDNGGESFNAISLNGTDVSDFAVASDDATIYVIDGNATCNATGFLFRSTNGGQSFANVAGIPSAAGSNPPSAVAVAPDTPDVVAVVEAAAGANLVHISTNGGTNWSTLPAFSANQVVTDIAVGPARAGTLLGREYAVALADTADNTTTAGDVQIIGSTTAWRSAGRNMGIMGIAGDADFMAVAFDPNFVGTRVLIAVAASQGTGEIVAGVSLYLINDATGLEVMGETLVETTAQDYRAAGATDVSDILAADIALPSDFDPTTGSGRRAYLVTAHAVTTNDDVFGVHNTMWRTLGAAKRAYKSVSYSGTIDEGTLFTGDYSATTVRYTSNPTVSLTTWTTCKKNPGLATNTATVVRVAADFATSSRVFAGTTGAESAFCVSNNGGESFDAEALIDNGVANNVVAIQDIVSTPDGNTIFMATDDGTHLNLWKSATPVTATSWSRVYVATGTQGLVRLNPDWTGAPVVYFADLVSGGTIRRSADGGDIFATRAAPAGITLADLAVQDTNVLYLAAAGTTNVYKSTTGCWTWGMPKTSGTGNIADLAVAKEDHLLVGKSGAVSWSTDGGSTFTRVATGLAFGNYQVLADDDYASDNIIYAGGSNAASGNIYRFQISTSTTWESLGNPSAASIVGLSMENGVIYSASANAVDRNLDPRATTANVAVTWDTMDAGAPANVTSFTTTPGSNVLYAADSATTLWAYNDLFATTKPVLTSPADGATVPIHPVTGLADLVTLVWQPIGTGTAAGNRVDIWIKKKTEGWASATRDSNRAVNAAAPSITMASTGATWTFSMAANTEYEWRVRYDNQVSGDIVRTPWSDPFTIKVSAPSPPAGGDDGDGGGGAGVPPGFKGHLPQSTTHLLTMMRNGVMLVRVDPTAGDGLLTLRINAGTKVLRQSGEYLNRITIGEIREPPALPEEANVIGRVYDLLPDGAIFDPPIILSIKYDPDEIPEGVMEEDLFIVRLDKTSSRWIKVEGTVNLKTHTITTKIDHFSGYAILASTRPAAFTVSNLSITPTEIYAGESANVSVLVTNTGYFAGTNEVNLEMDNVVVETIVVTLDSGDSETTSFSVTPDTVGECTVNVSGLLGTFKVKAPEAPPAPAPARFAISDLSATPSEVKLAGQVKISAVVTNTGGSEGSYTVVLKINGAEEARKEVTLGAGKSETVTFTVVKDIEGSYTVDIDGKVGQFAVIVPPPPTPTEALPIQPPINWWLIGGIMAGCLLASMIIWLRVKRRKSQ